jgi:hypothetical protein
LLPVTGKMRILRQRRIINIRHGCCSSASRNKNYVGFRGVGTTSKIASNCITIYATKQARIYSAILDPR